MKHSNNKGFTIIELMVVIGIIAIIGMAIGGFYRSQLQISKRQSLLTEMYQQARTAIYFMSNELRMVGFSPNRHERWVVESGTPVDTGLTNRLPTSVSFTYIADGDGFDNDGDKYTDENDEVMTVSFFLVGTDLIRSSPVAGSVEDQIIASGIEDLQFTYTTNRDTSINVGISILAVTSKKMPGGDYARRLYTTTIKCRNTGI